MDYPVTLLDRLHDSVADTTSYFAGCFLPYRKNNGDINIGRVVEIVTSPDGDHYCRMETPVNNWAAPNVYRPTFRVAADRVIAHVKYDPIYFNAGASGSTIAWYLAPSGARTRQKAFDVSSRDMMVTDYKHNPITVTPPGLLLCSYIRHQIGLTAYPTVDVALSRMADMNNGSLALALSNNLMVAGSYDENDVLTHVVLYACGLALTGNIRIRDAKEAIMEYLE